MKKINLYLILLLLILVLACKKSENSSSLASLKISNINYETTTTTITTKYTITGANVVESYMYISTDSADLAGSRSKSIKVKATYADTEHKYVASYTQLSAYTNYWIVVSVQDAEGKSTFSNIIKIAASGYNLQWQTGFSQQIKLEAPLYKDVILIGQNADTLMQKYKVYLGTVPCVLWKIAKDNSSNNYLFYVQVPATTPVGKFIFRITYNGNNIFNDNLEILQGNVYYLSKSGRYPYSFGDNMSFFTYNQNMYVIDWSINKRMDMMDSNLINWQQIQTTLPTTNFMTPRGMGYQIKNEIWFPPLSDYTNNSREVYIYSYSPINNNWKKIVVQNNEIAFPIAEGTFVYQDKLYSIIKGTDINSPKAPYLKEALMVFDPQDNNWQMVMELNVFDGYRGISIGNKVYLIASELVRYSSNNSNYKYLLYQINLNDKTLIKKNDVYYNTLPVGALKSNIFQFSQSICLYGGYQTTDFNPQINTDMYLYDTEKEKWTHLFLNPNFDIPGYGGFSFAVGNNIFVGIGLTLSLNNSTDVWKFVLNQ